MDIDREIRKLPPSPSVIVCKSDEGMQFFVAAEKQIVVESSSLPKAIVDLIATYFVFNMAYPTGLYPVFIFVQHHILGILDE